MNRFSRMFRYSLAVLLMAATLSTLREATSAALPPAAITLRYFRAIGVSNGVRLEWATGSEFDTAGFRVRRATVSSGPWNDIAGIGFVPAQGADVGGAEYSVLDTSATTGTGYWYQLVEVETDNSTNEFGPQYAVAGVTATPTPRTLATSTPSQSTAIPTSTDSPTRTPIATQPNPTSQSGATVTSPATLTPLPSATPTASNTPLSVSGNATATPFRFPTDTPDSQAPTNTPQAVGQLNTPTPQVDSETGYPQPDLPTATAESLPTDAYPVSTQEARPTSDVDSIQDGGGTGTSGETGNSSTALPPLTETSPDEGDSRNSGNLILWGGFLAALLVLGGGVYLSIRMFSRDKIT